MDFSPWVAATVVFAGTTALLTYKLVEMVFVPDRPVTAPSPAPRRAAPGEEDEEFVLHQGALNVLGPSGSLSMFCLKVEALLRVAGIRYRLKDATPLDAPKGKIPFATHGSTTVCDSRDMVSYLLRTHSRDAGGREMAVSCRETDPDGVLGELRLPGAMEPARLGAARAVEALLEHRTYYHTMLTRWGDDDGFSKVVKMFFASVPAPIQGPLTAMLRKNVLTSLRSQGIAAHAPEDVARRAHEDWDTVAAVLGGSPDRPGFLGGDHPCAEDCTLFAALDSCLNAPFPCEGKRYLMESHPTLVAYADSFRERFFADRGPVVPEVREGHRLVLADSG